MLTDSFNLLVQPYDEVTELAIEEAKTEKANIFLE